MPNFILIGVSLQKSTLFLLLLGIDRSVTSLDTQVQYRHCVIDNSLFYLVVERRVRAKAWHLVDLNQVWPNLMVYHNIEAKYLVTHCVLNVVWLTGPEQVVHVGLSHAHSLHNDVVDARFQLIGLDDAVVTADFVKNKLVRPLTSDGIVGFVLILDKCV